MKTYKLFFFGTVLSIALTGCETPEGTPDRTATGALIGAGAGVATGALIGGGRHGGEGALIGGALGAITGGLIGHSLDQEEQARLRAQAPQTYQRIDQGQPIGTEDIKSLVKAGISDDVIISQIRNSHTVYRLSANDIIDLHNAGVSQKVLDYMINTPNTAGTAAAQAQTAIVAQSPPPPPPETVVVMPGPGYVWVGGEWEWRGRWVWVSGGWILPPYPRAVWVGGYWSRGPYGWRRVPGRWR
jgi:surface antigen